MYILADKFIGNIINNELSYLEDDKFYYTNDGKNYKYKTIDKRDIYEGELKEFYCTIELNSWVQEPEEFKRFVENGISIFYVKVTINKNNDITGLFIVKPESVKNELLIEPAKDLFIDFNDGEKAQSISNIKTLSKLRNTFVEQTYSIKKPITAIYNANICFPNMYFREDVGQYVFKNKNIMSYKSGDIWDDLSLEII